MPKPLPPTDPIFSRPTVPQSRRTAGPAPLGPAVMPKEL